LLKRKPSLEEIKSLSFVTWSILSIIIVVAILKNDMT